MLVSVVLVLRRSVVWHGAEGPMYDEVDYDLLDVKEAPYSEPDGSTTSCVTAVLERGADGSCTLTHVNEPTIYRDVWSSCKNKKIKYINESFVIS